MDFQIDPYVGVGPITFGMARADVPRALKSNRVEVRPVTEFSPTESDWFPDLALAVFYDAAYTVSAVELSGPAVQPLICGEYVLDKHLSEIAPLLHQLDPDAEIDDDGMDLPGFGVGLWVPSPSQPITSVLAYRQDFWD